MTAAGSEAGKGSPRYQKIWAAAERIPFGRVATYGQIAALAGMPRQARHVGFALHALPRGSAVPWHRIINAQGKLSLPPNSASWREQRKRLKAEGVLLRRGVIDLGRFGWRGSNPSPLLD